MFDRFRNKHPLSGPYYIVVSHDLSESTKQLAEDLIAAIRSNNPAIISEQLSKLERKVDRFMATQEERLQAISTKIDEVLADLATLKTNNPQIEDEISAIEAKLSIGAAPAEEQPAEGGPVG